MADIRTSKHKWKRVPTKAFPERDQCARPDCGIFRFPDIIPRKNKAGNRYTAYHYKRGRKWIIYDPFNSTKTPPCGPPTKQESMWSS